MKLRIVALLFALLGARSAWALDLEDKWDSPEALGNGLSFSVRFGSYLPLIDDGSQVAGGGPYAETFAVEGRNPSMLMFEFQAEKYFFRKWGSLGVGFSFGYAEKYAPSRVADADGKPTNTFSDVKTSLQVIPLRIQAVYHLDYFALRWRFPLVPYGRIGVVGIPWIARDAGSVQGQGFRFGLNVTGGLAFMLDILDPPLARDMDTDLGVKHTYLFGEYVDDIVDGKNGLDLSSRTWEFGLALDF